KYDEPKIFITQVKKRSSGMPCPNWLVRYEVIGGPNAGLGPDQSKVVEVPTGADGKAAIELYLLEGNSGTSTIKATIIRPAGVDGGTKRLELHSSTVVNYWSPDAPLSMETIRPPQIPWDKQAEWTINVTNRSEVTKFGVVTLQLPGYAKLISSTPQTSSRTAQSDGGELVSWNLELPGTTISQIKFVLQAVTDDPVQRSQELVLELNPQLSMFPRESGEYGQGSTTGPTGPSGSTGNIYGQNPPGGPSTYAPESNIPSFPDSPASTGNLPFNGGDYAGINTGATTPSATQGHSDPTVFANLLQVECKLGTAMTVNRPIGVAVILTNTATVPFSMGQIQVELPDGLGFIQFDNNGAPKYVEENDNLITKQTYSLMDENGNDITVQPGQTLTLPINVAPTRVGTLSMKATVYGQSPNGQWLPIDGATHTGRTTATAQ
ncbi:MAG: hypothetical protein FWH27_07525, partial [Planctomycetaceae bacterium]|nr:hypothetical protein [Planctomycetaceae bacterium]